MIQTRVSFGRAAVICLLALGVCGCFSSRKDKDEATLAEESLVETLVGLSRTTNETVRLASGHIRSRFDDPEVQRHAIQWRLATLSLTRHCRTMPDARGGIIELWTRIYQMWDTSKSEFGKRYLGEGQPIAADALGKLVNVADNRIQAFFGPEHFDELREQVKTYAASHVITEELKSVATKPTGILGAGQSAVGWVLSLPLKPFEIGGGVSETAHSVQNVATVADRFTDVVDDLPEEISLQMDLMLLDLNRAPAIAQTLADIERITTSIEGFQKTAENLPDDIRKNVTEVLDEVDAKQEGLRQTIEEANGLVKEMNGVVAGVNQTVADANQAIKDTETTAASLEPMLSKLTEAGAAWELTADAVVRLVGPADAPEPPPPPPGEPVEPSLTIVDYGDTAEKFTATAVELRGLVDELLQVIHSDDLTKRLEDVDGLAASTVDHVTLRGIQLILAFFGTMLAYRFVSVKFLKPRASKE